MSKSKELSEFDRGSIEGCHICEKSVREIADILQKPKSTPQNSEKGSETKSQVLIGGISQEFQCSSEINVSSRTVYRELKHLGSHGRAAAHKPYITQQNAKHRLQWCRAHIHWTVDM
ncbi:uncharacterized protein TNCV_4115131 [Trichonephila clavipes]|nr:uncharacterized protein TNCV_4115131 [Trichonephila clavipes]